MKKLFITFSIVVGCFFVFYFARSTSQEQTDIWIGKWKEYNIDRDIDCKDAMEKAEEWRNERDKEEDEEEEIGSPSPGDPGGSYPGGGIVPGPTLPIEPPEEPPSDDNGNEDGDEDEDEEDPCEDLKGREKECCELEQDKEKAEEEGDRRSKSEDPSERQGAQSAYDVADKMEKILEHCCSGISGGGGGGGIDGPGLPGDDDMPSLPTTTTTTTIPKPPAPYWIAVCDFNSPSYQGMHKCEYKPSNKPTPDPWDVTCNMNDNKTVKVAVEETQTKNLWDGVVDAFKSAGRWIVNLFTGNNNQQQQEIDDGLVEITYNHRCFRDPGLPPPGPPEPPVTPPTAPPVTPPTAPPVTPPTAPPVTPPTAPEPPPMGGTDWCQVDLSWEKGFKNYTNYSLFAMPEGGVIDPPRLVYDAQGCAWCELTISKRGGFDFSDFLKINKIFGIIEPFEENCDKNNRCVFDYKRDWGGGLGLKIKLVGQDGPASTLNTGQYEITFSCGYPGEERRSKTINLNIFPSFRWREDVPVIR